MEGSGLRAAASGGAGDAAPPWGLDEAEAAARLRRDGPNELPRAGHRSVLRIALDTALEPMFALLLGAGALYLAFGDPAEAAVLLVFACLSVGIAVVQEARTERVLEALRDLLGLWRGMPEEELRSLVFAALVLTAVALTLVNRAFSASPLAAFARPNPTLVAVLAGAGAILAGVLLVPPLAALFRFGPLHPDDLALAGGAAAAALLLLEALKPRLAAGALAR
jgi:magnesium-transporting ATPase (P-type)